MEGNTNRAVLNASKAEIVFVFGQIKEAQVNIGVGFVIAEETEFNFVEIF